MSRPATWPIVKTILIAVVSAGLALILLFQMEVQSRTNSIVILVATGAVIVALMSGYVIGLGRAWLVLLLLAVPAMVLVPVFQPPAWLFPLIFLVLAGFYVNGVLERVPLYLTNDRTKEAVADLVVPCENGSFIDLGCGLGGVVRYVAQRNPTVDALGVETAPLSFLTAWIGCAILGPSNARIKYQSIWSTDVSGADAVYAFLSPAPMTRLNEKLQREMKPGATFVSNSFAGTRTRAR